MPGFDGSGPRGLGPMTGRGRGFCVVPLSTTPETYTGRGDYASYAVPWDMPSYGAGPNIGSEIPFASHMTRKRELDFLKNQAQAMRRQLEQIEARIQQLEIKP